MLCVDCQGQEESEGFAPHTRSHSLIKCHARNQIELRDAGLQNPIGVVLARPADSQNVLFERKAGVKASNFLSFNQVIIVAHLLDEAN